MPHKGQTKIQPEEIDDKVKAYFNYCEENNKKPNKQGLAVYLDVTSETLNEWQGNAEGKYDERLSVAIKKAVDRMSDLFQQRTDAMAIISMKQPSYGGFVDRPSNQASEIPIKITISGIDADSAAG